MWAPTIGEEARVRATFRRRLRRALGSAWSMVAFHPFRDDDGAEGRCCDRSFGVVGGHYHVVVVARYDVVARWDATEEARGVRKRVRTKVGWSTVRYVLDHVGLAGGRPAYRVVDESGVTVSEPPAAPSPCPECGSPCRWENPAVTGVETLGDRIVREREGVG